MGDAVRWAKVEGWAGYEVSTDGQVRSMHTWRGMPGPRVLSIHLRNRYPAVNLKGGGHRRVAYVHDLVLRAFVGAPLPGEHARHLDGNHSRSLLENLEWGSPKENATDRRHHGRDRLGEQHPNSRLTVEQVQAIRAAGGTSKEIAARFGVTPRHIRKIRAGLQWTAESIAASRGAP